MTRGGKRQLLLIAAGLIIMTALAAFAAFAVGLDRQGLWQVVRACVADFKLTAVPFPCLAVNLAGGEERGDVVLRPPLTEDMIVVPTRKVVGVEDPFLQSPDTPNYFDAAWRARSLLNDAQGRGPSREEVALVVNSALNRTQDQLHIHVGCLFPSVQRALAAAAPRVPIGEWEQLTEIVPHIVFLGTRIGGADFARVEPFRLAAEAFADPTEEGNLTIMVAAVRVEGEDGFLILASYAGAPHSWWPVGADDLLAPHCPAEPGLNG